MLKPKIALLVLVSALAVLPGCAALGAVAQVIAPYVVQILADIADAQTKLSQVETAALLYFKEHPDSLAEKRVAKAISVARQSLETASTTAKATGELAEGDYLAAFSGFYKAWDKLEDVIDDIGIRAPNGSLRVSPDGTSFDFPQPLCLKHRPAVAP